MPVFITRSPIDTISADAVVRPVSFEADLDAAHGFPGSDVPNHSNAGDVIVVPPLGSEQQHIMYANLDGIENDPDGLARSYREILEKAREYHIHSIAIPMFPEYESTALSPGQVYKIVRRELRSRPADEDLTIYLVLKWRQKLPAYRQLIANVSNYLRDVKRQRHTFLRSFLGEDSHDVRHSPKWQKKIPSGTSMPVEKELADEEQSPILSSSDSEDMCAPAFLPSAPDDITFYSLCSETDFVPDENAYCSMRVDSDDIPEPSEAADFPVDYEGRDKPFFDPARYMFTLEEGFAQTVLKIIDEKGLTDPQCYTRANLSRAVFNKLKQSALAPEKCTYSPSKSTALALVIALELSLEEANELLKKAGFAISHSNKRDIIVEYFLIHRLYDIYALNEVLFRFDLPLLGSA